MTTTSNNEQANKLTLIEVTPLGAIRRDPSSPRSGKGIDISLSRIVVIEIAISFGAMMTTYVSAITLEVRTNIYGLS